MKTLITALNSKFIHSSLAPWYLKASCGTECGEVKVFEATINDSQDVILASIYREKADIAAFSCYIWNISLVLKLAENLKKVSPDTKVILGGPEVTFNSRELLEDNPAVDFILAGEGEQSFKQLLLFLQTERYILSEHHQKAGEQHIADIQQLPYEQFVPDGIQGLAYRKGGKAIWDGAYPLIENLDTIPSPYTSHMLEALKGRIAYYEASRGCPFSCSYCISSTFEGVRHFSIDRVKSDLDRLITAGVRQVKFVDRTFNCNKNRAREILEYILKKEPETGFHFEVAADLFDNELIELISAAPQGLLQFEAGIQSTNPTTLKLIHRKTSLDRVFENIKKIYSLGSIHLHLDLIAGLPGEDFSSFGKSFDDIFSLKPHKLQLGFLKLLKGSRIRKESDLYGYIYRDYPPYEVLGNIDMDFSEILEIKDVEELVERYYNSGRFMKTLDYLIGCHYESAFSFFIEFACFFRDNGLFTGALSSRQLYTVILDFAREKLIPEELQLVRDLLKLDFLSSDNTNNLPEGLEREYDRSHKERCFDFLKDNKNVERYLPEFSGIPVKQVIKQVHFEVFDFDVSADFIKDSCKKEKTVILFKYADKNRVTGLYSYKKVCLQ